jgi:hypothetical protein
MGKKRFISCCSFIEPTKEPVKPNLTGDASLFLGTLVIKTNSSGVAISFRAAVMLIELEPIPDVSQQPVKCVARRITNNAESSDRSEHATSPGQCR